MRKGIHHTHHMTGVVIDELTSHDGTVLAQIRTRDGKVEVASLPKAAKTLIDMAVLKEGRSWRLRDSVGAA